MTVAAEIPLALYDGDGVTVAFPAPWRYLDVAHLLVEVIDASGVATAKTLGTHYTATAGSTDAGGTLTMLTPPASGETLRIRRVTPLAQTTQYPTSGAFPAKSHELALDRQMMGVQETRRELDDVAARALQVPFGEAATNLPPAAERANKFFAFGHDGAPVASSGTGVDAGLRVDLASALPGLGASLVLRQNGQSLEAALAQSDAATAITEIAARQGDAHYSAVFAAPPAADTPVITSSASSVVGGSPLVPTTDFYYDPTYRYDGTYSGALTTISGGIRPLQGQVCPEIVTDAATVEFEFLSGRTGTQGLHVRAIVDGKWCQMQMLRFAGTANARVFFRLVFPSSKVRRIKLEQEGCVDFFGVRLSSYTIARRPSGEYRSTFVCIGDSNNQGGQNIGDVSNSFYFCRWETHSRFQAALMGCDGYVNLGAGGTGWSDVVPSNPFSARIAVALAARPAVLFFAGSRNDSGRESQIISAVRNALALCQEVPVVLTCGPQQAGFTALNELVRQATVEMGRRFLNLDGVAASPVSNPTGHPTFAECLALARAAHAQTDAMVVQSRVDAAFYARPAPTVTLTSSITPPVASGTSLTFTATVTSGFAGRVQFYVNGAVSGSPVAISGGTAARTVTLPDGTNTVSARYLPNDLTDFRSATSAPMTVVVNTNTGFTDNFNRADGAVGSTANGKAWASTGNVLASWSISGNQLARLSPASSDQLTVDTGLANGVFTVTLNGTFEENAGLVFRSADGANYWRFNWAGTPDAPRLTKLVAGVSTTVATGTAGTWAAGDVIEITLNEANITVKQNGTTIVTATDNALIGNTRAGFWSTSLSGAVRWDTASFVGLP